MAKSTAVLAAIGFSSAVALGLAGFCETRSAAAAEPAAKARPAAAVQPAVNHSAPYTRLLGPASIKAPVRFADDATQKPAGTQVGGAKVAAKTVGWHHRYYAGYGGWYGGMGGLYGAPWAYYGSTYPYYSGYFNYGYRPAVFNTYQPFGYAYSPWVGGWSGYPNYTLLNPGFGGYYGVGYGGYGGWGNYGAAYGGCCYW
jgi:hypothetical protein